MAAFTEYSYGGLIYTFTDPVGRMFECPICRGVVKNAYSVKCCKKTFCKGCLDDALKKSDKCPLCRVECPLTYENDAIDDGVNDFKVLCIHRAKGCEWSGHLLHEPKHRKDKCGYEEIKCEMWGMGCEVVDERRYMKEHVAEECKYREISCEYCGDMHRAWKMGVHRLSCPEYPVSCMNGCHEEGLLHKHIDSHQEVCPEAVVHCPFAEMGCEEVQLKRKDVESHTTSAMAHHLSLMMMNFVEAKQTMQRQTDAHKSETEFLKARTEQLQVEADAYRNQTQCLKARIDQLQVETDAYRTQTDAVIKKLQAEVAMAATTSSKDVVKPIPLKATTRNSRFTLQEMTGTIGPSRISLRKGHTGHAFN